jgi:hypothetical protein
VIAINPDNQWAAEQLAALESGNVPPSSSTPTPPKPLPTSATSELKVETLGCPNCGGSVEVQGGGKIQTVVCNYCGSVLDLTPEQAAILGQADPKVKPAKPIELGMEGTFFGKVHQVIGWLRYEGWDDEEKWQWDEWLLVSSEGEFHWLSYDSTDGFYLYKTIQPREPFNPLTATSIKVPGGVARVKERSPARIVALAGELPWRAKVGDEFQYLDAKRGNIVYSVEYTRDEIELLAGHRLSEAQLWKAFGREDLVSSARAQAHTQSAQRQAELRQIKSESARSNRRIYMFLAFALVVFFAFICFCNGCSSTGGIIGPSLRSGSVSGPSTGGGFNFGK